MQMKKMNKGKQNDGVKINKGKQNCWGSVFMMESQIYIRVVLLTVRFPSLWDY